MNLREFQREILNDPITQDVWNRKYRLKRPDGSSDEATIDDSRRRTIAGIYRDDPNAAAATEALHLSLRGLLAPAGRINAGAGTNRAVTMINCYTSGTIQDSMPGIQLAIARAALTMQQGGGIGSDYSPIRPAGALVSRTGSVASGVIPFADQQDGMCSTISSAGERRGAMMLTLDISHPDIWNPRQHDTHTDFAGNTVLSHPSFITVKRQKSRLTQFNISILVSDAFMAALEADADWDLGFHVPRTDGQHVTVYDKPFAYDQVEMTNEFMLVPPLPKIAKGTILPWYVYRRVKARTLWHDIMRSNYKYAEPGVIFIDRINQRNNLYYCEEIRATNPCIEQPMPPNGACCLGSVNTAFLVKNPFTPEAEFDWELYRHCIVQGIRMLDNVLDVSGYPLEAQREESMNKRRIGLGITGWGDTLLQLGITYDSPKSTLLSRAASRTLFETSYETSAKLANERGPFPLFNTDLFLAGHNAQRLPPPIRDMIADYGIRNGVINTIAPNGSISLYLGNVSSGHEPIYSFEKTTRKVRMNTGGYQEFQVIDYGLRLFEAIHGKTKRADLPEYFVGALDISVDAHLEVHAAWQDYVDSAVSKTTNCATDMPFEDFKEVYTKAYAFGCKSVSTYRFDPDSGRGSVLSLTEPATEPPKPAAVMEVAKRPAILSGRTYKIKWGNQNWYCTINTHEGRPVEVFLETKDQRSKEFVTALTRTITAILRRGGDTTFLVEELSQVVSASGGQFLDGEFCPSVVAAIGRVLAHEFRTLGLLAPAETKMPVPMTTNGAFPVDHEPCPACTARSYVKQGACWSCLSCGYSTC